MAKKQEVDVVSTDLVRECLGEGTLASPSMTNMVWQALPFSPLLSALLKTIRLYSTKVYSLIWLLLPFEANYQRSSYQNIKVWH